MCVSMSFVTYPVIIGAYWSCGKDVVDDDDDDDNNDDDDDTAFSSSNPGFIGLLCP